MQSQQITGDTPLSYYSSIFPTGAFLAYDSPVSSVEIGFQGFFSPVHKGSDTSRQIPAVRHNK